MRGAAYAGPACIWGGKQLDTTMTACYNAVMFEIEATEDAEEFLMSLDSKTFARVAAAIDQLADKGPALGRPLVGHLTGSRHHNLKEVRVGTIRIVFAFDPRRVAVLLVAGDKVGEWNEWYRTAIPRAEELLDEHLEQMEDTG